MALNKPQVEAALHQKLEGLRAAGVPTNTELEAQRKYDEAQRALAELNSWMDNAQDVAQLESELTAKGMSPAQFAGDIALWKSQLEGATATKAVLRTKKDEFAEQNIASVRVAELKQQLLDETDDAKKPAIQQEIGEEEAKGVLASAQRLKVLLEDWKSNNMPDISTKSLQIKQLGGEIAELKAKITSAEEAVSDAIDAFTAAEARLTNPKTKITQLRTEFETLKRNPNFLIPIALPTDAELDGLDQDQRKSLLSYTVAQKAKVEAFLTRQEWLEEYFEKKNVNLTPEVDETYVARKSTLLKKEITATRKAAGSPVGKEVYDVDGTLTEDDTYNVAQSKAIEAKQAILAQFAHWKALALNMLDKRIAFLGSAASAYINVKSSQVAAVGDKNAKAAELETLRTGITDRETALTAIGNPRVRTQILTDAVELTETVRKIEAAFRELVQLETPWRNTADPKVGAWANDVRNGVFTGDAQAWKDPAFLAIRDAAGIELNLSDLQFTALPDETSKDAYIKAVCEKFNDPSFEAALDGRITLAVSKKKSQDVELTGLQQKITAEEQAAETAKARILRDARRSRGEMETQKQTEQKAIVEREKSGRSASLATTALESSVTAELKPRFKALDEKMIALTSLRTTIAARGAETAAAEAMLTNLGEVIAALAALTTDAAEAHPAYLNDVLTEVATELTKTAKRIATETRTHLMSVLQTKKATLPRTAAMDVFLESEKGLTTADIAARKRNIEALKAGGIEDIHAITTNVAELSELRTILEKKSSEYNGQITMVDASNTALKASRKSTRTEKVQLAKSITSQIEVARTAKRADTAEKISELETESAGITAETDSRIVQINDRVADLDRQIVDNETIIKNTKEIKTLVDRHIADIDAKIATATAEAAKPLA
jgi:hypothetical protein